jgi:alanyl-tRNA synthetase
MPILLQFQGKVISCKPVEDSKKNKKKNAKKDVQEQQQLFDVVFDDTVLFPEGGGQVSNHSDDHISTLPVIV